MSALIRVARALSFAAVLALALPVTHAQTKPNFSGTWELNSASTQLPPAPGGARGGPGDATSSGGAASAGGGGARGGGGGGGGGGGRGSGASAGAGRAPGRGFDPGPNNVGGRAPMGARGVTEAPPRRVTIRQSDTEITIGGTVYKLDGGTAEPTPIGRPEMKAAWDGNKLVIHTIRDLRGTNVTSRETRSLSEDGKTLRVEIVVDTPQGEAKSVQTYKKQ